MRRKNTVAQFWSHVDKRGPDECWEWTGKRHPQGYGRFGYEAKTWNAQRLAYRFTHGDLPSGSDVLHKCDNPPCCNPRHLFLGDQALNNADCKRKGRNRTVDSEKHHSAKLTRKMADFIRRSPLSGPELGKRFGISRVAVSKIRLGKTWRQKP